MRGGGAPPLIRQLFATVVQLEWVFGVLVQVVPDTHRRIDLCSNIASERCCTSGSVGRWASMDLPLHMKGCNSRTCPCAKYQKLLSGRAHRLLPLVHPSLRDAFADKLGDVACDETWLTPHCTEKHVELRCLACNQSKQTAVSFRGPLRLGNLLKHHNSYTHQQRVGLLFGMDRSMLDFSITGPSTDDLREVLDEISKGTAIRRGTAHMGKHKTTKSTWCLAEALRNKHREFLSAAVTLNLLRDERHQRLQIQFRAACADGATMSGILGLPQPADSTAIGLCQATLQCFKNFCTPLLDPPCLKENPPASCFNAELYEHLLSITEAITIDSAENEVVASYDMMSSTSLSSSQGHFKNMKHILRDKAHGLRRLLSRPWAADTLLADLLDTIVLSRGSIVQMIQHSGDFRNWLLEFSRDNIHKDITTAFSNLRAAKHRFESYASPLSRCVIDFDAIIAVATRIRIWRSGNAEARNADMFLNILNEEVVLTLAMLADCADECLLLLRHFDTDAVDSSQMTEKLAFFMDRISYLFMKGEVCNAEGHTKLVLTYLSRPHVFFTSQGCRTIGGPDRTPPTLINTCLQRLQNWVVLAKSVLLAEFPSHDILTAFGIFSLAQDGNDTGQSTSMVDASLRTIVAGLPGLSSLDALHAEFRDVLNMARYEKRNATGGSSNKDAWLRAFQRVRGSSKRSQERHPHANILHVFCRYTCWTPATSQLESCFSRGAQIITSHRHSLTARREDDLFMLLNLGCFIDTEDGILELLNAARQIWIRVYGKASRHILGQRIDKGLRHKWKDSSARKTRTHRAWLQRRRDHVGQKRKTGDRALVDDRAATVRLGQSGWSAQHADELAFQQRKLVHRKVESFLHSTLPEHAVDADVVAGIARELKKRRDSQKTRTRTYLRRTTPASPPTRLELQGAVAYVDVALLSEAFRRSLQIKGIRVSGDHCQATFFVLQNAADPPLDIRWHAGLCGGWILESSVLLGEPGFACKFRCAALVKRKVWVSAAFRAASPSLWSSLQRCAGSPYLTPFHQFLCYLFCA